MPCTQSSSKNAFVLSIVLWIVAAILVGITAISIFSKDTITLSKDLNYKLKTRLRSQDVLEVIKFYALTANYDHTSLLNSGFVDFTYKLPKQIILDGRWYAIDKFTKISLQDTSSMINILTYPADTIASLATTNMQKSLFYTIKGSVEDWRDDDNFIRLNGAENSTYKFQKKAKYKVRNRDSIQSIKELRLINGIDKLPNKQWKELKNRLYFGRTSGVNLTLVDAKYLAYLLHISESYAQTLINLRSKDINKFIKTVYNFKAYDDGLMGFYIAHQYKIKIITKIGDASTKLETLIDFKPTSKKIWTTINYAVQ
jgi:general secretion pathway protein K